ncbi:hypothetical protein NPIL_55391 [Nephila pilipes]|uniref:Uncharacterized protein n=1 Tax=Nephila pilipes TaxID=299642 RepID=A0A8X6TUA3_NEPPI|nr:hypothetical protein NPIL_55391 [Nephila pilipes]
MKLTPESFYIKLMNGVRMGYCGILALPPDFIMDIKGTGFRIFLVYKGWSQFSPLPDRLEVRVEPDIVSGETAQTGGVECV